MNTSNRKTERLSPELQKIILDFFEVASRIPVSDHHRETLRKRQNNELVRCPITGREYESDRVEVIHDQIGPLLNLVHPDTRKELRKMSPVACVKCREIVSWVQPGKDEDGFVIEPEKVYHIHCCPSCEPETFEGKEVCTMLIEKQLFLKYRK